MVSIGVAPFCLSKMKISRHHKHIPLPQANMDHGSRLWLYMCVVVTDLENDRKRVQKYHCRSESVIWAAAFVPDQAMVNRKWAQQQNPESPMVCQGKQKHERTLCRHQLPRDLWTCRPRTSPEHWFTAPEASLATITAVHKYTSLSKVKLADLYRIALYF